MTTPAAPTVSDAASVRAFLIRCRRLHCRRASAQVALRLGMPFACIALVLGWFRPDLGLVLAIAGGACVVLGSLWAGWRAGLRLNAAFAELADPALEDVLRAWLEGTNRAASTAPGTLLAWLGEDLARKVGAIGAEAPRTRGFHLGAIRYLVPVLAVLWLAWWLVPRLDLPWKGGLGGGGGQAGSGPGRGAGSNATAAIRPLPVPPQPAPPPPAPTEQDPLLDLPAETQVVIPEFVGDGPSRRTMAEVALLPGGGGAPPSQGAGGDPRVEQLQARPETFRRAAERAQQSRHVPPHERAIVARFFALLAESGR